MFCRRKTNPEHGGLFPLRKTNSGGRGLFFLRKTNSEGRDGGRVGVCFSYKKTPGEGVRRTKSGNDKSQTRRENKVNSL